MKKHRIGRWGTSSVVGCLLAALGCSERGYERISVSNEVLQRIDGSRAQGVLEQEAPPNPVFVLERPPFDVWTYRMASPTAIASMGPPVCRIIVGDLLDQALHLFDLSGEYDKSIAIGAPRSPEISAISALVMDPAVGTIDIYDAGRKKSVRVNLLEPGPPIVRSAAPPLLAAGLSGTASLDEVLLDDSPEGLGEYDLSVQEDEKLSRALNEGNVMSAGDTLWFARFVDGRIFKFEMGSDHRLHLARVVSPPVYFRIERPEHIVLDGPGEIPIQTQRHLQVFFVHDKGTFVYVQTVTPYERWTLVIAEQSTGSTASFSVGRVRALTTIDDLILTLESVDDPESWSRRREVVAYRNPLATGTSCREGLTE